MIDQKSTAKDILKSLEEQKFALDQSAIVAQTDAAGTILYINDKFCEISEYQRDELIGQNHRLINSGTHSKEFFQNMWRSISKGEIWHGEICNRAKSGRLYWVATTIVPFLDANHQPRQYLAIRQDITQLKQAEQLIVNQQEQLIASSKLSAIGEMAAAITHEINNPLGVILGRCEMIKSLIERGNLDINNLSRLVDTIDVTAKRIEKIIKSMRILSHEGHDDPFIKTPVQSILSDLVELFSEKYRGQRIQLTVNEYDPSLTIECRSHGIMQVFVNLLNNSFDAVSNLEKRWVRIEVQKRGPAVEISVTDSGLGIPPEIVAKLFMPFFSTKKVQYGTGLGLSISKSILQRHHGKLEYDSLSPFTRFVITLPQLHPQNAAQ
jgi:PAS domain S-box-containing protein